MPSRRFIPTLLLITLSLGLAACATHKAAEEPPVAFRRTILEKKPDHCQDDNCPVVNLDLLDFPSEPALNRLIDERLRSMTRYDPQDPIPATLAIYQQGFLASARPGWGSWLQAKLVDWHDQLLIIELSSYLFEGGAHGNPGRGFINYRLDTHQALTLQDILVPGAEGQFWRLVEQAYREWVRSNHSDQLVTYLQQWPFQRTANLALRRNGLQLKYEVASIAPYSDGHPELLIAYEQLKGVIRAQYL